MSTPCKLPPNVQGAGATLCRPAHWPCCCPCAGLSSVISWSRHHITRTTNAANDHCNLASAWPPVWRGLGVIDYHLPGWCMDGGWMAKLRLIEPRRKEPESEKITINLGYVDLGQVDLLVQEGFYSNRTDFIRTAIRNQLGTHGDVLKQTVARRSMVLGLQRYSRQDLESVRAAGEQLHIQVLGLATIDDDVPAQLAAQTIASIVILGALRASPKVKAALADRIR